MNNALMVLRTGIGGAYSMMIYSLLLGGVIVSMVIGNEIAGFALLVSTFMFFGGRLSAVIDPPPIKEVT